jgi:hypothetical protein
MCFFLAHWASERGLAMISLFPIRARGLEQGFLGIGACLLVLLVLAGCASASAPTGPSSSTSGATSTPTAGLSLVTGPLAPPPQNCALKMPPPQTRHLDSLGGNSNVQLVGGGVFWLYGGSYQGVLHLGPTGYTDWPLWKWVVEVGPNYTQPVTLRLRNEQTGALAWWTDAGMPPGAATQTLVLDPQTDLEDVGSVPGVPDIPHGSPDPGWKEWGLFPLFSAAGCYALEVSWASGSWQSVIAVGN